MQNLSSRPKGSTPSSGYANLLSHVLSSHPNYEAEMKLSKEAKIEGLCLFT